MQSSFSAPPVSARVPLVMSLRRGAYLDAGVIISISGLSCEMLFPAWTGRHAYTKKELDFIHGVLERGLLLENEHFPLAKKIISLYLNRVGFSEHDVLVLNGIPRHPGQAQDIATIAVIHAVVVLDCSSNDIMRRIRDNIGGDRTERIDDSKELIEKKLTIFRERTTPLIEHYTQRGCALYRINVSRDMTPTETYFNVSSLAAAYPPVTLVTEPPQR